MFFFCPLLQQHQSHHPPTQDLKSSCKFTFMLLSPINTVHSEILNKFYELTRILFSSLWITIVSDTLHRLNTWWNPSSRHYCKTLKDESNMLTSFHKEAFANVYTLHPKKEIGYLSGVHISSHVWIFISRLTYLKFNTAMHGHANTEEFCMNCGVSFMSTFPYLAHLDGADVWKHNFTAHGVLFECCTPVVSFVMVLADFIFQDDIETAFCALNQ